MQKHIIDTPTQHPGPSNTKVTLKLIILSHRKEGRVFEVFHKGAFYIGSTLLEKGAVHQKEGRVFQAFAARRGCNAPERGQGVSGLFC